MKVYLNYSYQKKKKKKSDSHINISFPGFNRLNDIIQSQPMHYFQRHSATGNIFAIAVDTSKSKCLWICLHLEHKKEREIGITYSSLWMAVFRTLWKNNKNGL